MKSILLLVITLMYTNPLDLGDTAAYERKQYKENLKKVVYLYSNNIRCLKGQKANTKIMCLESGSSYTLTIGLGLTVSSSYGACVDFTDDIVFPTMSYKSFDVALNFGAEIKIAPPNGFAGGAISCPMDFDSVAGKGLGVCAPSAIAIFTVWPEYCGEYSRPKLESTGYSYDGSIDLDFGLNFFSLVFEDTKELSRSTYINITSLSHKEVEKARGYVVGYFFFFYTWLLVAGAGIVGGVLYFTGDSIYSCYSDFNPTIVYPQIEKSVSQSTELGGRVNSADGDYESSSSGGNYGIEYHSSSNNDDNIVVVHQAEKSLDESV